MKNRCVRTNTEKMTLCVNCNNITHTYCNTCTCCGKSKRVQTSLTETKDVIYLSREEYLGILTLLIFFSILIGMIATIVTLFG